MSSILSQCRFGSLFAVIVLSAGLAAGCHSRDDRDSEHDPDTVSVVLDPNRTQELVLADVAKVRISPGIIPDPGPDGTARLQRTASPDVQSLWDDTAAMHRGTGKAAFEATISLPTQPSGTIEVEMAVPQAQRDTLSPSEELRVFYLNRYVDTSATGGSTNSVEPLELRGERSSTTLTVALPNYAFQADGNGRWVANVFVGRTATAALAAPTQAMKLQAWWRDLSLLPRAFAQATPADQCEGTSLVRPVDDQFPVTSPYGPRDLNVKNASKDHKGIDFGVPSGTDVVAAAKGKIELVKTQIDKQGNATGYGYYIILRHDDGGSTLYGHLQSGSAVYTNGQDVEAGAVIAKSGNTGTSSGPHLHFEYAPNGAVHVKATKVNPLPCLDENIQGALTVADNGNVADDAFIVSFNGKEICRTEIGLPNNCALNALRPGTYTLTVTALVAPDNIGTYSVTVNAEKLQIDGGKTVSNVIPTGGSATHVITVVP